MMVHPYWRVAEGLPQKDFLMFLGIIIPVLLFAVSRMREVSLLTELGQRSHLGLANVYSGGELA